jgi:hypothetical protein
MTKRGSNYYRAIMEHPTKTYYYNNKKSFVWTTLGLDKTRETEEV